MVTIPVGIQSIRDSGRKFLRFRFFLPLSAVNSDERGSAVYLTGLTGGAPSSSRNAAVYDAGNWVMLQKLCAAPAG
jgi:hypothetical protein